MHPTFRPNSGHMRPQSYPCHENGVRPERRSQFSGIEGEVRRDGEENVDTNFDYLIQRYPSVKVADSKKLVTRWTLDRGKSLVYFNRDLRCGRKLILQIESVVPGPEFGLVFGVTTCGPSQVVTHPYHLVDYCRPEYDCCGYSNWLKLYRFDRIGSWVSIERVYDGFIRISFNGRFTKDMIDHPERGFGRSRTYPFIMLTGCVSSVRILSSPPSTRPQIPRPALAPVPFPGPRQMDQSFPIDAWISNRNVTFDGMVMRRGSSIGGNRNYIFSSRGFGIGKTISFQVKETDNQCPGTITFGVTTHSPESVTLENLPINSNELMTNRFSRNWYLSQDIIESIRMRQSLSLRRTPEGFTVKTGFKKIRYLFYVDPNLTVYPFFNFNGAVRSIELVSNSVAAFNMTTLGHELQQVASQNSTSSSQGKCVICLDEKADHMATPCKHVAFCQSCSTHTMSSGDRKCPLCRTAIESITKIFLA